MIRSIIQCEIITQPLQNVSSATVSKIEGKDLNYPSFLVTLTAAAPVVEVRRTVTNVGEAVSAYTAEVVAPPSVAVEVVPPRLEFGSEPEDRLQGEVQQRHRGRKTPVGLRQVLRSQPNPRSRWNAEFGLV